MDGLLYVQKSVGRQAQRPDLDLKPSAPISNRSWLPDRLKASNLGRPARPSAAETFTIASTPSAIPASAASPDRVP